MDQASDERMSTEEASAARVYKTLPRPISRPIHRPRGVLAGVHWHLDLQKYRKLVGIFSIGFADEARSFVIDTYRGEAVIVPHMFTAEFYFGGLFGMIQTGIFDGCVLYRLVRVRDLRNGILYSTTFPTEDFTKPAELKCGEKEVWRATPAQAMKDFPEWCAFRENAQLLIGVYYESVQRAMCFRWGDRILDAIHSKIYSPRSSLTLHKILKYIHRFICFAREEGLVDLEQRACNIRDEIVGRITESSEFPGSPPSLSRASETSGSSPPRNLAFGSQKRTGEVDVMEERDTRLKRQRWIKNRSESTVTSYTQTSRNEASTGYLHLLVEAIFG